eukprot:1145340-Pelagomonas_calceolata.AAC.4
MQEPHAPAVHILSDALELGSVLEVGGADGFAHDVPLVPCRGHLDLLLHQDVHELLTDLRSKTRNNKKWVLEEHRPGTVATLIFCCTRMSNRTLKALQSAASRSSDGGSACRPHKINAASDSEIPCYVLHQHKERERERHAVLWSRSLLTAFRGALPLTCEKREREK